jgi:hypothetical protein
MFFMSKHWYKILMLKHACLKQSCRKYLETRHILNLQREIKVMWFWEGIFCKYYTCNNILILVTGQNIVLHKANFIYRMNKATVKVWSLQISHLNKYWSTKHILYMRNIYCMNIDIIFSWPKEYLNIVMGKRESPYTWSSISSLYSE